MKRRRHLVIGAVLLTACVFEPSANVERFLAPPGALFRAVAESLVAHGIVRHPTWFRLAARLGRYDRTVKAGLYEFHRGEATFTILRALRDGKSVTLRLTIPEGYTVEDIADLVASTFPVTREQFLAAATDSAIRRDFGVPAPSMEGFLRPETYRLPYTVTASALVRELATSFRSIWNPAWDQKLPTLGLTRLQFVTLASIVEGEARIAEERPIIAAVYLNRIRRGMLLQADPTVQYALIQQTGHRKPRLFETDYLVESPYNTYIHPGLPPGPVGAPSRESLDAVGAPADVPFLYFVARGSGDGHHVFTRTYSEHLQAVARYRRETALRRRRTAPSER